MATMNLITRKEWTILVQAIMVGMLFIVVGAYAVPSAPAEPRGPLKVTWRKATPEESLKHQQEMDRALLAEYMKEGR